MSIGARIREIRKDEKVSQTVFAERMDTSRSALRAYELDEREPSASFLLKLHSELSIDPTWLLTGRGSPRSEKHGMHIICAVTAVRTYAAIKGKVSDPDREARLVLMLVEYFDEGGDINNPLVNKMMEAGLE